MSTLNPVRMAGNAITPIPIAGALRFATDVRSGVRGKDLAISGLVNVGAPAAVNSILPSLSDDPPPGTGEFGEHVQKTYAAGRDALSDAAGAVVAPLTSDIPQKNKSLIAPAHMSGIIPMVGDKPFGLDSAWLGAPFRKNGSAAASFQLPQDIKPAGSYEKLKAISAENLRRYNAAQKSKPGQVWAGGDGGNRKMAAAVLFAVLKTNRAQ